MIRANRFARIALRIARATKFARALKLTLVFGGRFGYFSFFLLFRGAGAGRRSPWRTGGFLSIWKRKRGGVPRRGGGWGAQGLGVGRASAGGGGTKQF